jgi:hypothetical protein
MKKYIFGLLGILLGGFALSGCTDQDYEQLDKGSDRLTLTAAQEADTLAEINHANNAITLNWTTGNNAGTGNKIGYRLELAKAGTNFAEPYTALADETQVYTWSINVENLNSLILDKFGGTVGKPTAVDARISAIVPGVDEVQTDSLTFHATPYQPVTTTLYLLGDAAPNGWSADNAEAMTRTDNGIFTWEGNLKAGNLKFITTLGQFLPSYSKGADGLAFLRTSDSQPDGQWKVTEEHYYKVTANLLTGEVSLTQEEGNKPPYDFIYFVGDMTGWSFEKMTQDPLDNFLFRYGHYFDQGGTFKFGTAENSWENMYKATQDNAPYTDTSMELVSGFTPDYKWNITDSETGKAYKVCVDIRKGKERMMMREFTPYSMIYLVGDASPSGWDIANATPMTATDSPYIFTWTGTLNAGELKFSCDRQADWMGAWFLCAAGDDVEPTGQTEKALFINKSDDYLKAEYKDIDISGVDQKWKITTSGTYTITLNQLEETVSIIKQ